MIQKKYYDGFMVSDILQKHIDDNALYYRIIESFSKQPTADVVERKTGEWFVDSDGRLKCSNCSKIPINKIRIRGNLVYDMNPIKKLMKFCPNCGAEMLSGADMRGEKNE